MAVVLAGTLDTKGPELLLAREELEKRGLKVLLINAGTHPAGDFEAQAEISAAQVFQAAGTTIEQVRARNDRGEAVAAAAQGVAAIIRDRFANQNDIDAILGLGGSAGTTIATAAMREAPFGVPKVMVSTLTSGQTRPYVGGSDIAMFASVADIAGLNRITRTVITNATAAVCGMVEARKQQPQPASDRPIVVATMFGVTTPCVQKAREILEAAGVEVWIFHATGVGGQAMEGLIRDGVVQGVLDITTTEMADELVGGTLSAGPDRLKAAGRRGVPQVVSVGAIDMVNFGPMETVPERFRDRKLYAHNPTVTLMRTTVSENAQLGERIAAALKYAQGPTTVLLPLGGVSGLDAPGKAFYDPEADQALFQSIELGLNNLDNPQVHCVKRPEHINDPAFAELAARTLLESMGLLAGKGVGLNV